MFVRLIYGRKPTVTAIFPPFEWSCSRWNGYLRWKTISFPFTTSSHPISVRFCSVILWLKESALRYERCFFFVCIYCLLALYNNTCALCRTIKKYRQNHAPQNAWQRYRFVAFVTRAEKNPNSKFISHLLWKHSKRHIWYVYIVRLNTTLEIYACTME